LDKNEFVSITSIKSLGYNYLYDEELFADAAVRFSELHPV
jgi:hypothetical protein